MCYAVLVRCLAASAFQPWSVHGHAVLIGAHSPTNVRRHMASATRVMTHACHPAHARMPTLAPSAVQSSQAKPSHVQVQSVQSSPVCPVQSSPVQSSPVQSSPVQSSPVQSSPVQSSPVQSSACRHLLAPTAYSLVAGVPPTIGVSVVGSSVFFLFAASAARPLLIFDAPLHSTRATLATQAYGQ